MPHQLLRTKLYVPQARAGAVSRPRLLQRLTESMRSAQPFTLVCGPAGSGKTTLLSQFASRLKNAIAWLSLDDGDNDPARFWTHLISACQTVLPGVGQEALSLLHASHIPPAETLATMLINDVASLEVPGALHVPGTSQHRLRQGHVPGTSRKFVLILDDYHLIHEQSIHAAVSFLLEHAPRQLHLVLATRSDPPFALARYRARNRLLEIRGQDLRFSADEAATFLSDTAGLNLSTEDVAALEARTEGWIAGLQLAALALQAPAAGQQRADPAAFIHSFAGSHVYVAGYLLEEVLRRQPQATQSFLIQTSLLQRLHGDLCDAVTGGQDGRSALAALQRTNSFVIPLDDEGNWYRYHHLFADLLQARLAQTLSSQEIAALHTRAAHWYERNRFVPEAVKHALAANDFERVADLVKQEARALIFSGRVNILSDWLEGLPQAFLDAHPHLNFYRFWIDLLQRKADLSEHALQEKEDLLRALPSSPENDRLRGELMAVLCRAMVLSGLTSQAIRLAREALAYLPAHDSASRARANSTLAIALELEGQTEEALSAFRACSSQASVAGDHLLAVQTTTAKGLIQYRRGQLHEATRTFQKVVDMGKQDDFAAADGTWAASPESVRVSRVFFPAGQGYIGLASIHLEWNELQTAENLLEKGMDLCRRGGLDGIFMGRMLMSRLRQARGDLQGALEEIQFPQQALKDTINVATRQIQIGLARGDVDGAWFWAAPLVDMLNDDPAAFRPPLLFIENPQMSIARVYLARGEIKKALQLLGSLQATGDPGRRIGHSIEIYLLRALAHQEQNGQTITPETIENIEHALELAAREGHVLLFLEEGKGVIPLLQAVVARRAATDPVRNHARKLLDAFGQDAAPRSPGEAHGLVETLTPREMEVLQLIAAGLSNKAIANRLFITVRTVKKHAGNVYGKLNVSRRTEAVARARELDLLPHDS